VAAPPELHCPVLVLRGGTRGSMLSAATQQRYLRALPRGRAAVVPDAGHVLWQPAPDAFVALVERFARALDASGPA
jgi:pimeloyl-ACP methyl ester carboxylesterase